MKRTWAGGAYPNREGIEVTADAEGITIEAWYDGGIEVLSGDETRLTWDELTDLRNQAEDGT